MEEITGSVSFANGEMFPRDGPWPLVCGVFPELALCSERTMMAIHPNL